jgi:hypothetical protein
MAVTPAAKSDAAVAELETQWRAIQSGEASVPHDKVARWLSTWGTPAFKPWRSPNHGRESR